MGITRYNELHRRRTEMTDAIKENNGVVGLHASAPPSSHTHALSGICETSYVSPSKPSYLSTALSFTKICTKPDCWRPSTHRAGPSPGTSIVRPITTDTLPSPPSPPMCAGSPSPTIASSASRTVRSPSPTVKWAVRTPRTTTLDAMEFLRRLLQHVLPDSFMQVLHFGFLHASSAMHTDTLRQMIVHAQPIDGTPLRRVPPPPCVALCPTCGAPMRVVMRRWTAHRAFVETG